MVAKVLKGLKEINDRQDRINFARDNKAEIIKAKKDMPKNNISIFKADESLIITPEFDVSTLNLEDNEVFIVGNSVGFLDSHDDVSMRGSWDKTVHDRGDRIPIIKDHVYKTNNLFAENKSVVIKEMPIKALGYNKDGSTQVLAAHIIPFEDIDTKKYETRTIKQHSVGLWYISLDLAINDPEDTESFKVWTTNIGKVINMEEAIEQGFFFPIFEQKLIEISQVVFASNTFTPAFTNNISLAEEPPKNTQQPEPIKNLYKYLNAL